MIRLEADASEIPRLERAAAIALGKLDKISAIAMTRAAARHNGPCAAFDTGAPIGIASSLPSVGTTAITHLQTLALRPRNEAYPQGAICKSRPAVVIASPNQLSYQCGMLA